MHDDLQRNLHVLHGGGRRHQIHHSQEVPKPQTHRFRGSRDRLVSHFSVSSGKHAYLPLSLSAVRAVAPRTRTSRRERVFGFLRCPGKDLPTFSVVCRGANPEILPASVLPAEICFDLYFNILFFCRLLFSSGQHEFQCSFYLC